MLRTELVSACFTSTLLLAFGFVTATAGYGAPPATSQDRAGSDGEPNLLLAIDRRAIAYAVQRDVHQTSPVNAVVMGTNVYGRAETDGQITAELIPHQQQALMEIQLAADVQASTVGRRGPVTAHGTTSTQVSARKRLALTADGIAVFPATATAATNSAATQVNARCELVRRFAQRQVNRMRPQTAATASRSAESQSRAALDAQVDTQAAELNQRYRDDLRSKAEQRGVFPSHLAFSSTADQIRIAALVADRMQPAPASQPVALQHPHDVRLSIHHSLPNNLAQSVLGGQTVTDRQFADFLQNIVGEVPRPFRLGTHLEKWAAILADEHPFHFQFDDHRVAVSMEIRQLVRDHKPVDCPLVVSADYQPRITRFGLNLQRQGPVRYLHPDGRTINDSENVNLSFVRTKFDAFFTDDIYFRGLVIPPGGAFDKFSKFRLSELNVDDQWFVIGVSLPQEVYVTR